MSEIKRKTMCIYHGNCAERLEDELALRLDAGQKMEQLERERDTLRVQLAEQQRAIDLLVNVTPCNGSSMAHKLEALDILKTLGVAA